MQQHVIEHKMYTESRRKAAEANAYQRWLQTEFAVIVATGLIERWEDKTPLAKKAFVKKIKQFEDDQVFKRLLDIPDLWDPVPSLTLSWAEVKLVFSSAKRTVRCGIKFQLVVSEHASPHMIAPDAADCLLRLFGKFMPRAPSIFVGPFTALQMLAANDFIMEKAFLYGVIALSKWLGQKHWHGGLYGHWPPPAPKEVKQAAAATAKVSKVASQLSTL